MPEWWQVAVAASGVAVAAGQYKAQLEQQKVQLEQSHDYIIGKAVRTIMEPYLPPASMTKHIVARAVVDEAVTQRLRNGYDARTTIIAGQFQVGKTMAVDAALRGEQGIVKVTVDTPGWKAKLYNSVGVTNEGMFVEAMRKATEVLGKPPLLYLDVPRHSTANIHELSVFCKELVTDERAARGVVVASQLSVALGFDAGGHERQRDIWIDPMTRDQAREYLVNNFPKLQETDVKRIIEEVGTVTGMMEGVAGDVTGLDGKKAMSIEEALQVRRRACKSEALLLLALKLPDSDGKLQAVGQQIAVALLKTETVSHEPWDQQGINAKAVADKIKNIEAFAVSFNTETRLWHFASPMHKRCVETAGLRR